MSSVPSPAVKSVVADSNVLLAAVARRAAWRVFENAPDLIVATTEMAIVDTIHVAIELLPVERYAETDYVSQIDLAERQRLPQPIDRPLHLFMASSLRHIRERGTRMPRGDKSKYTDKQKRQAEHIEEGYESRGVPETESERRAWATVNAVHKGGEKPGGGGYGKPENRGPMRKGGRKGGSR
jgi:plasmid stabilization system protein ParE